jgi:DNA polymerase III subunit epsilon
MSDQPEPPPAAWARRPWTAVTYASLDFEATGLDFSRNTIISFGVVPIDGARIDVGGSVYQLVDPAEVELDHEAIAVHGLRPIDLASAPSLDAARETLLSALERRFLVTWFAEVEAAFLDKLFGGGHKGWMRRSLDVRRLVAALEGDSRGLLTLSACAERYGIPVASPHHALDDALVTAQLFLVTAAKMSRGQVPSVRELARAEPLAPPALRRPRAPW